MVERPAQAAALSEDQTMFAVWAWAACVAVILATLAFISFAQHL